MIDRIPSAPVAPATIRLHAWYGSAGALLRELSRAINQGQTLLRADSGLPVGTSLVLVMSADCLSSPIEVQGTVTAWRVEGPCHEMTLRYDFDPGPQRARLDEALAELRAETRRPRRTPRVPLTVKTDAEPLARDLEVTVENASRAGARLRIAGKELPPIEPGSRLVVLHRGRGDGMRRPLRMVMEVRWVGARRRSGGRRTQVLGGRFVDLSDSLRQRLQALVRFEEARPELTLQALLAPLEPPPARAAPTRRKKSRQKR